MADLITLVPKEKEVDALQMYYDSLSTLEGNIDTIVTLAYSKDGRMHVSSNNVSIYKVVFMLEDFKQALLTGHFEE